MARRKRGLTFVSGAGGLRLTKARRATAEAWTPPRSSWGAHPARAPSWAQKASSWVRLGTTPWCRSQWTITSPRSSRPGGKSASAKGLVAPPCTPGGRAPSLLCRAARYGRRAGEAGPARPPTRERSPGEESCVKRKSSLLGSTTGVRARVCPAAFRARRGSASQGRRSSPGRGGGLAPWPQPPQPRTAEADEERPFSA